ncbi:MAG: hypothetical protein Q8P83_00725 [bacterium]|nr:hypothetical protein [bacterium]
MPYSSDVEEQLAEQREREELERMYRLEEEKQNGRKVRDELAKEAVKQVAKKAAKKVGEKVAISEGIIATAAATSVIWVPVVSILAVVFLVFCLFFFMIMALSASCSGSTSNFVRSLPTLAGPLGMLAGPAIDQQICGQLAPTEIMLPATDAIAGQTPEQLGLVPITGVPVEGASDPRLRQCMLTKVQTLYQLSQAAVPPLDWVVTSAYRPNDVGSYHARGEAVDIAFRNPALGFFSSDPRINQVIQLARSIGFVRPAGDVVDEYNQPSAKTEGPHIHLEFNYNFGQNASYCDLG